MHDRWVGDPNEARQFGVGRGKVYPAAEARALLNPLRRLVQPPGRLVRRMALRPDARVLEVGCGPGYFSPTLLRAVPRGELVVLDLQAGMLRHARARVAEEGDVAAVQADAGKLPFRDATFDNALLVTVLGELPDPTACGDELRRILAVGGRVTIAETRRDADFIPLADLREILEPCGLVFVGRRGRRWEYTATFERLG